LADFFSEIEMLTK